MCRGGGVVCREGGLYVGAEGCVYGTAGGICVWWELVHVSLPGHNTISSEGGFVDIFPYKRASFDICPFCTIVFRYGNAVPFSAKFVANQFLACMLWGLCMQFMAGYFFLHSWSNMFAELLRFADREFYAVSSPGRNAIKRVSVSILLTVVPDTIGTTHTLPFPPPCPSGVFSEGGFEPNMASINMCIITPFYLLWNLPPPPRPLPPSGVYMISVRGLLQVQHEGGRERRRGCAIHFKLSTKAMELLKPLLIWSFLSPQYQCSNFWSRGNAHHYPSYVAPLGPLLCGTIGTPLMWHHWDPSYVAPLGPLLCGTIGTPLMWHHWDPSYVAPLGPLLCGTIGTPLMWHHWDPSYVAPLGPLLCGTIGTPLMWHHWDPSYVAPLGPLLCGTIGTPLMWHHWDPSYVAPLGPLLCGTIGTPLMWHHWDPSYVAPLGPLLCGTIGTTLMWHHWDPSYVAPLGPLLCGTIGTPLMWHH